VPHLLPLLSPEIWTPRQQTRRKPGTTQHGEGPGRGASQAIPNSGKHSGLGSTRHLSHWYCWWGRKDSNLRSHEAADLQSPCVGNVADVDRLGFWPSIGAQGWPRLARCKCHNPF